MVTAEMAAALPALVLVVLAALWAVMLGHTHLRVVDAAREAVRAAARGEDPALVIEIAEQTAPPGAVVEVVERDGVVIVEVSARVNPPLPFGDRLPAPTVRADATAFSESRP
jgi:hypothetical protein